MPATSAASKKRREPVWMRGFMYVSDHYPCHSGGEAGKHCICIDTCLPGQVTGLYLLIAALSDDHGYVPLLYLRDRAYVYHDGIHAHGAYHWAAHAIYQHMPAVGQKLGKPVCIAYA